jgi:hypothetical protein
MQVLKQIFGHINEGEKMIDERDRINDKQWEELAESLKSESPEEDEDISNVEPIEKDPTPIPVKKQETPTPVEGHYLKITAVQFVQARGIRKDGSGGFLNWSRRKFGIKHRLSIKEWISVWDEFRKSPTGKPIK